MLVELRKSGNAVELCRGATPTRDPLGRQRLLQNSGATMVRGPSENFRDFGFTEDDFYQIMDTGAMP